jgi:amino acid transporter
MNTMDDMAGVEAALPFKSANDHTNTNTIIFSEKHEFNEHKPTIGLKVGIPIFFNAIVGGEIVTMPGVVWNFVRSPGMALVMWILGGLGCYCGAFSYTELGTMLPKNGGELVYLRYCYKKPRQLFSYLYTWCGIV